MTDTNNLKFWTCDYCYKGCTAADHDIVNHHVRCSACREKGITMLTEVIKTNLGSIAIRKAADDPSYENQLATWEKTGDNSIGFDPREFLDSLRGKNIVPTWPEFMAFCRGRKEHAPDYAPKPSRQLSIYVPDEYDPKAITEQLDALAKKFDMNRNKFLIAIASGFLVVSRPDRPKRQRRK